MKARLITIVLALVLSGLVTYSLIDGLGAHAFLWPDNPFKTKSMRTIHEIIIHCSATREGLDFRAADIDRWHRERGWHSIGYHYVIDLDGTIEKGRALSDIGAHCSGHNAHSIGICYIGGLDENGNPADTRTPAQRTALLRLIHELKEQFPEARVYGHRDFSAKSCPCFNARAEFSE